VPLCIPNSISPVTFKLVLDGLHDFFLDFNLEVDSGNRLCLQKLNNRPISLNYSPRTFFPYSLAHHTDRTSLITPISSVMSHFLLLSQRKYNPPIHNSLEDITVKLALSPCITTESHLQHTLPSMLPTYYYGRHSQANQLGKKRFGRLSNENKIQFSSSQTPLPN
jgi:hypothetical protein